VVYNRTQSTGLYACTSRTLGERGNRTAVSSGRATALRTVCRRVRRRYTTEDMTPIPMLSCQRRTPFRDTTPPIPRARQTTARPTRRMRVQKRLPGGYGRRLTTLSFNEDPVDHRMGFAAIIGRPNAGKSTLMNHILGQQLSIVTAKAQTTRHKVSGIWSEPGHQVVFLDTPGIIINQRDELEERMMNAVGQAIKDADILLAIVDATDRPQEALEMLQPGEDWRGPPMAILLNKVDLMDEDEEADLIEWYERSAKNATVFPISADSGDGVAAVQQWVVENIPDGPSMFPKDVLAEANERFFVSEIIRKQVFEQYRQELPYQVTVLVTDFKERRPPQKTFIAAQVVVEKERHVKLLVGAKGVAIKALSKASREEIEEFLDSPVYLDLSVKVVPKWRSEKSSLERLGYGV
jgi:GTP-binding protein Era